MAVIDTFLKLMVNQRAERLVLLPEEIPTLYLGERSIPLAMPAVPLDLARRLAVEVAGSRVEGEQAAEGAYQSDDGDDFTFLITPEAGGCRIEMFWDGAGEDEDGEGEPSGAVTGTVGPKPAEEEARPSPEPPRAGREGDALDADVVHVLDQAVLAEASDVFLSAGRPVRLRLNGAITPLNLVLSEQQILALVPESNREELARSGSVDFGMAWKSSGQTHRVRVNVFHHTRGLAAALRPIRSAIPSLDDLHLPADLLELCSFPSGLVLVTGASGSGKSTTLAALVDHINRTMARHIITIEDPVEFEHRDAESLVHQRELGSDVESFSSGLRAALRENPDVILLGEMRDLATISAALTAAETGHLVLSTLHTGSATAAVNRIVDVYPGEKQSHVRVQLASSLRAVVAQRLVPSADHSGRLPVLEKLLVTPAVASGIRDGQEHHMQNAMQTGAEEGMVTLERSLAALVRSGRITRETAHRYAVDRGALQKLLE